MALKYAGIEWQHREVYLKEKPPSMLAISKKATVPVLQLPTENDKGIAPKVIDESLEIMRWALLQSDQQGWLAADCDPDLLDENDTSFKYFLDRYKYSDRYPEYPQEHYLARAMEFLQKLEMQLQQTSPNLETTTTKKFLGKSGISWVDVAVFPFVRQFAFVDKCRFDSLPLPRLQAWLAYFLASDLFLSVMEKQPFWQDDEIAQVS